MKVSCIHNSSSDIESDGGFNTSDTVLYSNTIQKDLDKMLKECPKTIKVREKNKANLQPSASSTLSFLLPD